MPLFSRRSCHSADPVHSLEQQVARLDRLQQAWKLVSAAGGGAGIDQVSIVQFKKQAPELLKNLSSRITAGQFQFQRLRSAAIPKPDGDKRMLGIPAVIDRVALQAIRLVLEPVCEPRLHPGCHAYRPERGATTALEALATALTAGRQFVVETDIRKFFDSVRHKVVLQALHRICPQWSGSPLLVQALRLSPGRWPSRCGLAQGSPLSPLLANVSLLAFDEEISTPDTTLIRYADDLLLLTSTRTSAEQSLKRAARILGRLGLQLHPDKTRILDARSGEFEFLGFRFQPDRISPSPANWQRLHDEVRHWCSEDIAVPWTERIDRINGLLRSFACYYHQTDCGRMLWNLDQFVREQLLRLEQQIGSPDPPWSARLVNAQTLRQAVFRGKRSGARRWNGYG